MIAIVACIGIDCRFSSTFSGLGTYTRSLVPLLVQKLKHHHLVVFVTDPDEPWLDDIPPSVTLMVVPYPHYSIAEQLLLPYRLKQTSIDLLFSPHFNVPLLSKVPSVVVIHDLILHRYPNQAGFIKRLAYRLVMWNALRHAKRIVAVSEFTQSEITSVYGDDILSKTTVVTEGYSKDFAPTSEPDLVPAGYFLYVGNAKEHKNVQVLLDAHEQVEGCLPLVLVTGGDELNDLRIPDRVSILTEMPHERMPAVYSNASYFVTPSLYEGFCLPILEARACGCPIIAANTSAIPEVAGPGALLVEPTVEGFMYALQNPPHDTSRPERKFNWDSAAQEISGILTSALNG